jgi:hypothetical protein
MQEYLKTLSNSQLAQHIAAWQRALAQPFYDTRHASRQSVGNALALALQARGRRGF